MTEDLTIGVLLFEDVEELDVVGPWEVLGFWASHVATAPVRVLTVGRRAGVVRASKGLGLVADHAGRGRRGWICSSIPAAAAPGAWSRTRTIWTGHGACTSGAPSWRACARARWCWPPPVC
ncbi:hypothetical protein [Streptomyces malaysiense]|uniref:hypothetical protein n=1 Tax=Streptomyces malaysiense TaxID=1428626 RepID=UPI001F0A0C22|nr:hypothetical protein [Streptomyces malaysiense]